MPLWGNKQRVEVNNDESTCYGKVVESLSPESLWKTSRSTTEPHSPLSPGSPGTGGEALLLWEEKEEKEVEPHAKPAS